MARILHKLISNDPKLVRPTPSEVIEFIEENYVEMQGVCYCQDKELKSNDPKNIGFYFDYFHGVLEIQLTPIGINKYINEGNRNFGLVTF